MSLLQSSFRCSAYFSGLPLDSKWNKTEKKTNKNRREHTSSSYVCTQEYSSAKHDATQCVRAHAHISISKMSFSMPLLNLPVTIVLQIMVLRWASGCIAFSVCCLWILRCQGLQRNTLGNSMHFINMCFQQKLSSLKEDKRLILCYSSVSYCFQGYRKALWKVCYLSDICILYVPHSQGNCF